MIDINELKKLNIDENKMQEEKQKLIYDTLDKIANFLQESASAYTEKELVEILKKSLPKTHQNKELIASALNYVYSFAKKGIKTIEYNKEKYFYYDDDLKTRAKRVDKVRTLLYDSDKFIKLIEEN